MGKGKQAVIVDNKGPNTKKGKQKKWEGKTKKEKQFITRIHVFNEKVKGKRHVTAKMKQVVIVDNDIEEPHIFFNIEYDILRRATQVMEKRKQVAIVDDEDPSTEKKRKKKRERKKKKQPITRIHLLNKDKQQVMEEEKQLLENVLSEKGKKEEEATQVMEKQVMEKREQVVIADAIFFRHTHFWEKCEQLIRLISKCLRRQQRYSPKGWSLNRQYPFPNWLVPHMVEYVVAHPDVLLGPKPQKESGTPLQSSGYVLDALDALLGLEPLTEDEEFGIPSQSSDLFIGRFFEIRRLVRQIDCLVDKVDSIIDKEEMDPHKAFKVAIIRNFLFKVNSLFKVMAHWIYLIRIIYGKYPKVVYCFVDDVAPLDALLDYLQQSPSVLSLRTSSEILAQRVEIVRAILMDPPPKLIEDGSLKEFEFVAREVGFIISSIHLNSMGIEMAEVFSDRLNYIFLSPSGLMGGLEYTLEEMYAERPKPSRMYYPKTAQLHFLDLLLDNLGELLLKAKADNASSIRLLKFHILALQQELQELSFRVREIPEPRKQEADAKDSITNIANLAYEAEYAIDSFLVADIPIWCSMLWLRHILQELGQQQLLIERGFGDAESIVNSIVMDRKKFGEHQIVPIFHDNTGISDTLEEVSNLIRKRIFACTRSVVSSYAERKRKVFLDLLNNAEINADSDSDEIDYTSDMSEAELERSLYYLLRNKSYLVILEDVQDIYALNDIKRVLPKSQGCQKVILFTTSSSELVVQCRRGFNQMSEHHPSISQADKPTIEMDVVGFTKETERMLGQIIVGEKEKLLIISIVGTAGQGKTTLATKLFNHHSVKEHFYIRACCCVSQVYQKRQLLLELLNQVVQLSETDCHGKTDVELVGMLCNQLRRRRFLIFLDDMWTIDAWKDLARCFPDDNNGSRIIFTTRIEKLAFEANSKLQPLGPLSDKESLELLRKKLLLNERCPTKLLEVAEKIAKNCKGLPLAVVLIAGLLLKMERKVDHWERIANNLSSIILNDPKANGKGIIELSYMHLPDHLKSCFLYFGVFLEDREVQVSNLIRLWIGEGLVKHSNSKNLEDVAGDYIGDLVGRNLVTIAQKKSNGGVKSCRVHDLLREFCLIKASEENFLQLLDGYDEQDLSFDHNQDPKNSSSSTGVKYHLHRLCIYPERNHFNLLKSSGPYVRSLMSFAVSDMCPSYSYDISFIFHNFKFLKTLNLEGINVGDSFKEITHLILLRYLAFKSDVDLIPSSIANLWNLQTFFFELLGDAVVKVSDSLWDMTKLRHVHINKSASFDLRPDRLENSSTLENLQTFSTPSLAYGNDMVRMLRRVHGIRKLKCKFLDSWNEGANCNQFPDLGFLRHLESLNVFYNGEGKYPCEFSFPSNLKKLTLSNFRMPWYEISQLGRLCKLEVLKLLGNAFEGKTWKEDVVFPKLKFLKLDTLNVEEWTAASYSFPILERLVVHNCKQLKEIPLEIGEIETLEEIEVMWCNSSIADSAREIQEERLQYSHELKIRVQS